ncbi:hypothetical protein [Nonomuraea aurantiaca]|uniref:hypothetical protein n=1 Tax=Nonomuraea aurantiaca TaxID=2878562 RepID=UPI001CD92ED6|nr:hypothetical protein [Nonomuraea aurantiaca]MCA2225813.1 hypothetical protein [Nonomuraea aurantiaca]
MGGLRCVDGSYLTVTPVACTDSVGTPYEITLELRRDGAPCGIVGERCGWLLARLARGVSRAREEQEQGEAGKWPDPDDRFPGDDGGSELFSFRYRARSGAVNGGELRCQLRTIPIWLPAQGEWRVTRRAYVEAWGSSGVGMRAVLTSSELAAFVHGLVDEVEDCLGGRDSG